MPPARTDFLLALVATGAVACGAIVEQAPFPARPDTVRLADLLGPYDGIVVDADTERPIPGALVAGSWAFERGVGLVGPAGTSEFVTETGPDGRYRVPRLESVPGGLSTRVRRFTLIVYRRGYVGWRSDRRFRGGGARRDFAQRGSRVRLERWADGDLHNRHLAFLGGGGKVRAASAWEVQPASLELEGLAPGAVVPAGPAAPVGPAPLDASAILAEEEVRGVTGYVGKFEIGRLADLPQTEFYDSRHFKAEGKPESFDVALRVWRLGHAAAEEQYRKLLAELPGARSVDEIGDASLRARAGDILGLAFLSREHGMVVSLTCGVSQCPDDAAVLKLAKLCEGKLLSLPRLPVPGANP